MNGPYRLGMVRSLWVGVCLLMLNGCASMMAEERVGAPVRSEDVREARSIGTPRMTLLTHDDGLGWTVSAEMRTERNTLYQDVQACRGRRYVFSPFSVFPGLFQCPVGLLHLFDDNPTSNILRFGCARLVMLEPLDGVTPLPATTSSRTESVTEWKPLGAAVVQAWLLGQSQEPVSYAMSAEGRTDVRLSDLLSRLVATGGPIAVAHGQTIRVRVRYGDGSHIEEIRPVEGRKILEQLQLIRTPIPSEEWPSPTIIQVRVEPSTIPPQEAALIADRIQRDLLQRRMCVVVEGVQRHLADEWRVQYSGMLADAAQVPLGKFLSPSTIFYVSAARSNEGSDKARRITIELRDVREGRIFGTASGTSRSGNVVHVLERTLTELDLLMAKAPQAGCPR